MIKRIFDDIKFRKMDNVYCDEIIESLQSLRKLTDYFTMFPKNTGYSWKGVKSASISLFSEFWIELPHYYSEGLLSDRSLSKIANTIAELKFKQLIFNGYPPYFGVLAAKIKDVFPQIKIKVIYHGFLAELSKNEFQKKSFNALIEHKKSLLIDEIGFVKKGLSKTLNKLYGWNTKEIILINPKKVNTNLNLEGTNIGVLVNDSFRKNFHNMIYAGLLVDQSKIHVTNSDDIIIAEKTNKINAHGFLNHDKFLQLLGSMSINLHSTFSEASGGQVCSESISQGVPCISAYTSAFFDYDDELKERLIVDGFDDSWHIYQKIEEVLKDREYLSKRCLEYTEVLNNLAQQRLNDFLNA